MARRVGRRPGRSDTRERILATARETFAEHGYNGASIRAIAAGAEVDPALIHHYFGTKERLFAATVEFPVDPSEVVADVIAGDIDGVGERLIARFLQVWDSPAGVAGVALFRSAADHQWVARLLREFITTRIFGQLADVHGMTDQEARYRGSLVASQLAGLVFARYVIRVEPLASLPREQVVAAIGPTIQRYVTGAVAGLDPDGLE